MEKIKIEIQWAFVYAVMTLTWAGLGKLLGFMDSKIAYSLLYNTLILIPSFVIYLLAAFAKRTAQGGIIRFRQVFISGLVMTGFITILGIFTTIIFLKIIAPGFFEHSINYVTTHNKMPREQALAQFNLNSFIIQGILGAIVTGGIFSLITSFIVRKKAITLIKTTSHGNR
ncbi:DUF4199 domain-containing protein [Chitinophaga sp. 22321]|uniref:DUF4199 domain-containing protein n=1 Tax=Chitinophaga hostae TaxID=2831022 RepID=A0ABS5J9E4_9BACT|nr:DUF4199 domain-containing protein [Chitinophaga hostae]MBS0031837.1 DUF4199 domain-containing protein [Chitinophaga hostae]